LKPYHTALGAAAGLTCS